MIHFLVKCISWHLLFLRIVSRLGACASRNIAHVEKLLEDQGSDHGTSWMLNGRSTILANSLERFWLSKKSSQVKNQCSRHDLVIVNYMYTGINTFYNIDRTLHAL